MEAGGLASDETPAGAVQHGQPHMWFGAADYRGQASGWGGARGMPANNPFLASKIQIVLDKKAAVEQIWGCRVGLQGGVSRLLYLLSASMSGVRRSVLVS